MFVSPTLVILPIIFLVFLVLAGVSFWKFGFRTASYGLFGIGLVGTLLSLFFLPFFFPWMNEGNGGLIWPLVIAPIVLPILSILGVINMVIAVRRFFQKIATKGDYVFLALAGLIFLLTMLMVAELWG